MIILTHEWRSSDII